MYERSQRSITYGCAEQTRRMRGIDKNLRVRLAARLQRRRAEIEQATITRVYGLSAASEAKPEYEEGLRHAVSVAVGFAIDVVELGDQHTPCIPGALLAQARLAARSAVPLDMVLRRYVAGYMLLDDFLRYELEHLWCFGIAPFGHADSDRGAVLDRLLAAVSSEYERGVHRPRNSIDNDGERREDHHLLGQRVDHLPSQEPIENTEEALAVAILRETDLANSLCERYLWPLDRMSVGSQVARQTIEALLKCEHNVSSAAHVLNVHRSTVHRWRNEIEELLGCRLCEHQIEVEVALRIAELIGAQYEESAALAGVGVEQPPQLHAGEPVT